jgi:hypothetical protein
MAQKDYKTVVVDGRPTRVRYNAPRIPASERHTGLLPSRVQDPATTYKRRSKHRRNYEEDA